MNKGTVGNVVIVLGLILVIVGMAADAIGIGRHPGMGTTQWGAVAVGVILAVVGFVLRSRAAAAGGVEAAETSSGDRHAGPEGPA